MIKLIATDIDGTLLNTSRQVSDRNRAAIHRAAEAGIIICYASGRLVPTLRPIIEMVGHHGPMVTCNGAYVESSDGTVLADCHLSESAQQCILDYSEQHRVTAHVYQPYVVKTTHESRHLEHYRNHTKASPEILGWERLRLERATKMIFVDDAERIPVHSEFFHPRQSDHNFELTFSDTVYMEFLPGGVSKRTGLESLIAHLDLDREEVAVIGDFHNDREMVEWAGLGAAMGNAVSELKDCADMVVPGNNDDGFAVFIEHVLDMNRR